MFASTEGGIQKNSITSDGKFDTNFPRITSK